MLADARMPGARWFPGAQVNYAHEVLRHVDAAHAAGMPAIVSENERGEVREMSWPELRRQVASCALALRALGVQRGDRVAAYLPNVPETMVAFLACSSIGAVWSVCAPDMGTAAVVDRFRQIEPRLLIAADGVHYGGKALDRSAVVQELRAALPSVEKLLLLRTPFAAQQIAGRSRDWSDAVARDDGETAAFEPEWLPFDHPIWIVYSSGTTGLPKPIVHGQGGILADDVRLRPAPRPGPELRRQQLRRALPLVQLHRLGDVELAALGPGLRHDRAASTTAIRPAARRSPTGACCGASWRGTGHLLRRRRGVLLQLHEGRARGRGLRRSLARCARSAAPARRCPRRCSAGARRSCARPARPTVWWYNISGGTDFCGAFVGGNRELPEVPGQMQCRFLGAAVEAWNEQGQPVIGEVGELVCTQADSRRCRCTSGATKATRATCPATSTPTPASGGTATGFRIGEDGGCIIYGRSDATINRQGLRMGTSEIYSAVEGLPEVLDSMVVDLEYLGRESYMPLFVVLRPGVALDDAMRAKINGAIKTAALAALRAQRHLPGGRDPAHALGQEAGAADQEAAAGPADREGGEPRGHGQSGQPGLVRGLRGAAGRGAQERRMRPRPVIAAVQQERAGRAKVARV